MSLLFIEIWKKCCLFLFLFHSCAYKLKLVIKEVHVSHSAQRSLLLNCIAHFPTCFLRKEVQSHQGTLLWGTQELKRAKCCCTLPTPFSLPKKNKVKRKLTADVVISYTLPAWTRAKNCPGCHEGIQTKERIEGGLQLIQLPDSIPDCETNVSASLKNVLWHKATIL